MYVCMYACMHVCMYACMHVCMHACMHACMYAILYYAMLCHAMLRYTILYSTMMQHSMLWLHIHAYLYGLWKASVRGWWMGGGGLNLRGVPKHLPETQTKSCNSKQTYIKFPSVLFPETGQTLVRDWPPVVRLPLKVSTGRRPVVNPALRSYRRVGTYYFNSHNLAGLLLCPRPRKLALGRRSRVRRGALARERERMRERERERMRWSSWSMRSCTILI